MATTSSKQPTTLIDLPPEIWDHITSYLTTASSITSLGRTSKSLHTLVEKDAWNIFSKTRFPSTCPQNSPSWKDTARTLTTLAKAQDRRAFAARYIEPRGNIIAYPGKQKLERWKKPQGQTIGFTPQLDVFEEVGPTWNDRNECLAFSAGAEVCIRHTRRYKGGENVKWQTYRPVSAFEGRDDISSLHLLRPEGQDHGKKQKLVAGTANGDLRLISLPGPDTDSGDVEFTYLTTQGRPVRSSALLQRQNQPKLLAVGLGEATLALYPIDSELRKICPSSELHIKPPLREDGHPGLGHRTWSTNFISPTNLAVGVGPSDSPLRVYTITESGLSHANSRKFSLRNDSASLQDGKPRKKPISSVYTSVPLPAGLASSGSGDVFFSGAFDGIIRLHDLRSDRDVVQAYVDPADQSAIYSLMCRGQEKILAGTSMHSLLKVFDLRVGGKHYDYLDVLSVSNATAEPNKTDDYNVYLQPNSCSSIGRGNRGSNWAQSRSRSAESSVYSLASPSPHSPYVYAGIENTVLSLAFTEALDSHPDPVYFDPWSPRAEYNAARTSRMLHSKEVFGLAMYDQTVNIKLSVQRNLWETWRPEAFKRSSMEGRLDQRWRAARDTRS